MSSIKIIKLIYLLIILFFLILLLKVYCGTLDDYSPQHVAVSLSMLNGIFENSSIYKFMYDHIPAYYIFISELLLIPKLKYELLPTSPIMIFPLLAVFWVFIYILSNKNLFISTLMCILFFTNSTSGTFFIFLWPHGLGEIFYYLFLIFLIYNYNTPRPEYRLLLIITIVILPFISYNKTFFLLLILSIYSVTINVLGYLNYINPKKIDNRFFIIAFSLLIVVELGLMEFVYHSFLPLLVRPDQSFIAENSVNIFIKYFFGHSDAETPFIKDLLITTPRILTHIYILKYIIYSSFIFGAVLIIYNKRLYLIHEKQNSVIIFISIIFASIIYILVRTVIGQFTVVQFFYPMVISIVILFGNLDVHWKKLICLLVTILILLNFVAISVSFDNNLVQRDDFGYILNSAKWSFKYLDVDHLEFPDQMTFGWFLVQFSSLKSSGYILRYLDEYDKIGLYEGTNLNSGKTIVINYRINYNQVGGWYTTKPFYLFKDKIDNNQIINKIYNLNNDISIYQS